MTKEQITAQLDAAGIEYDGRLSAEKLAELLPEEEPKGDVTCRVLRDFWDADGIRTRKGSIIEVSAPEAMDGMENGSLERVKA